MAKYQQKPGKVLLKQAIMSRVLVALLPCVAGSVYFFGWRMCVLKVSRMIE